MPERSSGDPPSRSVELERDSETNRKGEQQAAEAEQQRELLDQVIRETLSSTTQDFATNADEYLSLIEVGRRHPGGKLSDSVVQELVKALLDRFFRAPPLQPEVGRAMATDIAATLVEDAPSRDLLERLWTDIQKKCGSA